MISGEHNALISPPLILFNKWVINGLNERWVILK